MSVPTSDGGRQILEIAPASVDAERPLAIHAIEPSESLAKGWPWRQEQTLRQLILAGAMIEERGEPRIVIDGVPENRRGNSGKPL